MRPDQVSPALIVVLPPAAPQRPPISATTTTTAGPNHQVIRFQTIAPVSAGQHQLRRTINVLVDRYLAMVRHRRCRRSALTRFISPPASPLGWGEAPWSRTTVAMELAVSWKFDELEHQGGGDHQQQERQHDVGRDQLFFSTI